MEQTLGQRLAATRQAEREHSLELLRHRATNESPEAQRKFTLVEAFFEEAKADFEQQIVAESSKVELLVGYTGDRQAHREVEGLLSRGNYSGDMGKLIEQTSHPYFPLWKRFKEWAAEQGLSVKFNYRHDGVGLHSWYVLSAEPVLSVKR